jgi:dinuclear metal center YbgI/SA1388 family protein
METVASISAFLEELAPSGLAAEWDNVGLLVGETQSSVRRVMTCLTLTRAPLDEALSERADLIVAHHPLPFHPLKRITGETPDGALILRMIRAGISLYSIHTGFDSARDGINERLATGLSLTDVEPLVSIPNASGNVGVGRYGITNDSPTLYEFAGRVKSFLDVSQVQVLGSEDRTIQRAAVACGSAGDLIEVASEKRCDCLVLGEARFHACLEAEARGMCLILAGHYATERFAVVSLAEVLARRFKTIEVWASRQECDPVRRL